MEELAQDQFEQRAPRVPLTSRLILYRGGRKITAKSVNISNTGILVESVSPLELGEFLVIEMGRSATGFRMVNFGIVVRLKKREGYCQYGLSFVESPPVSHCMTTDLAYQDFLVDPGSE